MDLNKVIIALVIVLVALAVAGFVMFNPLSAKQDSQVIVTCGPELNEGDAFSIKLTDLNGTPISNQNVNVTILGSDGGLIQQNVVTDANGDASFQLNGSVIGNCVVGVNYGGNENYTACNTTQNIQIKEKVVQEQTQASKEYYTENGNRIILDTDHTAHVVDSHGNTIPGSGSNYYMDGDRVILTGKG
jgi:hypothetical protein